MPELGNTTYFNRLVNKVTGVKVKVLNDNTWLKTVSYYDERGRVIQTIADNYAGGVDRSTIQYDFAGRILSTLLTHTGIEPISVLTQNSYDHASRLTDIHHTINGGDRVNIAHYEYNELGQLVDKKLHFNTGLAACSGTTLTVTSAACATVMATQSVTFGMGFSFVASAGNTFTATVGTSGGGGSPTSGYLQSVDYRYNIRGWLSSINNSALTADGGITNDDNNDVWGMELRYNNPVMGIGTPQYNGNITEMIWNRKDHTTYALLNPIGYSYSYDPANRLINAKSATKTSSWGFDTNYDETFGYDKNGNMAGVVRYGLLSGVRTKLDDLSYVYNGNQRARVDDSGDNLRGFVNKVSQATEYNWDANGNMTSNLNKGINISYNMLNLPLAVSTVTGNNLSVYVYDALGIKLATKNYQDGVLASTTNYIGGLIFTDNALEYLLTAEGRVTKIANNWNYEYFMKDHLGSVRMSFDKDPSTGNARIIQENAYYSYGSGMPGMSWILGTENLLKYNGKEEQKKWNVTDYGARFLDKDDPGWATPDPLANLMRRFSPYAHAFNNPLRFIDPDGMKPNDVILTGQEAEEAFKQLQQSTSLKLNMDDKGKVTATGDAKTDADKKLREATTNEKVDVQVNATSSDYSQNGKWFVGGAFGGSEVKDGKVTATQTVNPKHTKAIDKLGEAPKGVSMLHEILESYIGAIDSPGAQAPTFADVENKTPNGVAYENAHNKTQAIDPRHKAPNTSIGAEGVFISKFPYSPNIPAILNPELLLFNFKK